MSGNTLGTLFCVTSFGESHGPAIGCVVDGCPPGLALAEADIQRDLDRRKPGHVAPRHAAARARHRRDPVRRVRRPHDRHADRAPDPQRGSRAARTTRTSPTRSGPGHADYTYWQKYGIRDYRGGGRQSARETAVRVAAGAIAKKWLAERYGVRDPRPPDAARAARRSRSRTGTHVDANPFFVANATIVAELEAFMDALRKSGDSCGAKITVDRERRAGRLGRAGLRQARRRPRAGDDGHQRGEGRRDRRRASRRRAEGHRALRRDDAAGLPVATTPAASSAASRPGRTSS